MRRVGLLDVANTVVVDMSMFWVFLSGFEGFISGLVVGCGTSLDKSHPHLGPDPLSPCPGLLYINGTDGMLTIR